LQSSPILSTALSEAAARIVDFSDLRLFGILICSPVLLRILDRQGPFSRISAGDPPCVPEKTVRSGKDPASIGTCGIFETYRGSSLNFVLAPLHIAINSSGRKCAISFSVERIFSQYLAAGRAADMLIWRCLKQTRRRPRFIYPRCNPHSTASFGCQFSSASFFHFTAPFEDPAGG